MQLFGGLLCVLVGTEYEYMFCADIILGICKVYNIALGISVFCVFAEQFYGFGAVKCVKQLVAAERSVGYSVDI